MTALSCPAVREALPWFAGDDLDPSHAAAVRAHLVQCWSCRAEAAALQQGRLRLQQAAAEPVAGIDDAFFAGLHRRIVDDVRAVELAPARALAATGAPARVWIGLAALLLVGLGFWAGRGSRAVPPGTTLGPTPLATPAAFGAEPLVVPWSGSRLPMRWLGEDRLLPAGDEPPVDDGEGAGMMGRTTLRSLVDDRMVLPRRQPQNGGR